LLQEASAQRAQVRCRQVLVYGERIVLNVTSLRVCNHPSEPPCNTHSGQKQGRVGQIAAGCRGNPQETSATLPRLGEPT